MIYSRPVTEIIQNRFSCRTYREEPIEEDLQQILREYIKKLRIPIKSSIQPVGSKRPDKEWYFEFFGSITIHGGLEKRWALEGCDKRGGVRIGYYKGAFFQFHDIVILSPFGHPEYTLPTKFGDASATRTRTTAIPRYKVSFRRRSAREILHS